MPSTKTSSTVVLPNAGGGEAGKRAAGDSAEHAYAQAVQAQDLGLSNATPQSVAAASSAGSATSASRSDHAHAHGNQAGGTLHATAVANTSAGFISASDQNKLNGIATTAAALATTGTPANVAGTAALGSAATAAHSDHVHAHGAQTDGTMHAAATNAAPGFAVLSTTTPVSLGIAAVGTGTTVARADHAHAHGNQAGGTLHANAANGTPGFAVLSTASPQDVAAAASVGVSTNVARDDHAHFHGNQAGGSLHALASGSAAGFMQPSDFSKLAGVEAGAQVTSTARVLSALATANTNVTFNAQRLSTVATPTATDDAATKAYVDAGDSASMAAIAAQHTSDLNDGRVRELIQGIYNASVTWASGSADAVAAPMTANNGYFYLPIQSSSNTCYAYSNDLSNWTTSVLISGTPSTCFVLPYGSSQSVVIANNGRSYVGNGAIMNNIAFTSTSATFKNVAKSSSTTRIIAVATNGHLFSSDDITTTIWSDKGVITGGGLTSTSNLCQIVSGLPFNSFTPVFITAITDATDSRIYTTFGNGNVWVPSASVTGVDKINCVAYTGINGMRFLAVGRLNNGTPGAVLKSDDATSWTIATNGGNSFSLASAFATIVPTPYCVFVIDKFAIWYTRDGSNWGQLPAYNNFLNYVSGSLPPKYGAYCDAGTSAAILLEAGSNSGASVFASERIVAPLTLV